MLHKKDGYPLNYQKVCSKDGKVIDKSEIAKGYEVRKGEFILFDDEELEALRPESDRRIRLDKFVLFDSVDPIYLDKSYIVAPDRNEQAYSLLLTILKKKGMAGVGKYVLRTKENLILLHEYKDTLLLTTLHYGYEVVNPRKLEEVQDLKKPTEKELELAEKIIENLSGEFDITEYRDTFTDKVQELVEKKLQGETITVEAPKKEEIRDLMAALQETLKQIEQK